MAAAVRVLGDMGEHFEAVPREQRVAVARVQARVVERLAFE